MNRKRILPVVLTGLLVLFSAAALALRLGLLELPGEDPEEVLLSVLPLEEVNAVEWSDGESPAFRLERETDGMWRCPDRPEAVLDQEKTGTAVAALCQVVSGRKIEDWEDASVYGLDPPRRRVELILSDGTSVCYLLGDRNTYTNRYYFQLEGERTIHLVGSSVGETMYAGMEDYIVSDAT